MQGPCASHDPTVLSVLGTPTGDLSWILMHSSESNAAQPTLLLVTARSNMSLQDLAEMPDLLARLF